MKNFEGTIVSVSMNNTAIVEVVRRTPHPLYKKLIKRSSRYHADTNGLDLRLGNKVKIVETRPISKHKFFKVAEIVGLKNAKKTPVKVIEKVEAAAPTPEVKTKKTVRKTKKETK